MSKPRDIRCTQRNGGEIGLRCILQADHADPCRFRDEPRTDPRDAELATLRASLAESERKREAAEERAREALEIVREVEWAGVHSWGYEESGCPMCGAAGPNDEGPALHTLTCRLAALLETKGERT